MVSVSVTIDFYCSEVRLSRIDAVGLYSEPMAHGCALSERLKRLFVNSARGF